jgi:DNA-directed RNA polymerase specialized sigma24 family protein
MGVTEELIDRAMQLDPEAARALLADRVPAIQRIALALTGRSAVADAVTRGVLERSLRVMPNWRRGGGPENWFYHHTVITAREALQRAGQPSINEDRLVMNGPQTAGYRAFIQILRGLPAQQAEAFLLNHGERLNERLLGVAMDCSATAAAEHLRSAEQALRELAGDEFEVQTTAMSSVYHALTPKDEEIDPVVWPHIRRLAQRRRLRLVIRLIGMLLLMAAGVYWVWKTRK